MFYDKQPEQKCKNYKDMLKIVGIGLKTWIGQDNQKIAEYRNTRIRTTMNAHGLAVWIFVI